MKEIAGGVSGDGKTDDPLGCPKSEDPPHPACEGCSEILVGFVVEFHFTTWQRNSAGTRMLLMSLWGAIYQPSPDMHCAEAELVLVHCYQSGSKCE